MKYDDASWHYEGDFPAESPEEYGGTHIALLLKWCFIKGWAGEIHTEEEPEQFAQVSNGTKSATSYLFEMCDGKLTDEDVTEEGNGFLEYYYGDEGEYLADYAEHFEHEMYLKSEAEHDFQKFSAMVEQRYQEYLKTLN